MKKIDIRDIANIKDMPAKEIAQIRSMVDIIAENTKKLQDLRRKNNCEKNLNARASVAFLINSLQSELKKKYNKFLIVTVIDEKLKTIAKKAPAKKLTPAKPAKKVNVDDLFVRKSVVITPKKAPAKVEKKVPAKTLKTPDNMSQKTMKRLNIDPKKRILDLLELEKIGARFEKTEKKAVKKIEKIEKIEKIKEIVNLEKKARKTKNVNAKNAFVFEINKIKKAIFSSLKKIEIKRIETGIKSIYAEV